MKDFNDPIEDMTFSVPTIPKRIVKQVPVTFNYEGDATIRSRQSRVLGTIARDAIERDSAEMALCIDAQGIWLAHVTAFPPEQRKTFARIYLV